MAEERREFQAEVAKLLSIVANALYSEKEVFLRELVSNASDACDKLRYAALTQPALIEDDPAFKVLIGVDRKARTLSIKDNGIGMNRDDLVENLGTIARSGTGRFLEELAAQGRSSTDLALIGQFGVGFYAAFMVAERVEVVSRKAGETQAWKWLSDGAGAYTVGDAERAGRGTTVTLTLKADADEYLDEARIRTIVKKYSDHIAIPIVYEVGTSGTGTTLNTASALWTRPKKDITDDQYKEFYRHAGHLFDEPWLTLHARAEGKTEYTLLLFVPATRPLDIFDPDRKSRLKLYVKRVFITDDCEDLVPAYLRFLRGIVDAEDLPLNISRELLQNNPLVVTIRKALTKRVLGELAKKAEAEPEGYATFWQNFGAVLKEGVYEDPDQRDAILKLARFKSTQADAWTSLGDYLGRLKEGQNAIYYISGDDAAALKQSPQLEGFKAKGLEVLLLTDPIDEFWIAAVPEHEGKKFVSVTRGGVDLAKFQDATEGGAKPEATAPGDVAKLIALLKLNLGDKVKDVRTSARLTESPVCLVADEGDLDLHLERILKQHKRVDKVAARILEINARHALIKAMADAVAKEGAADALADAGQLLLDQALIVEGETLPDPAGFARRMSAFMARGLGSP